MDIQEKDNQESNINSKSNLYSKENKVIDNAISCVTSNTKNSSDLFKDQGRTNDANDIIIIEIPVNNSVGFKDEISNKNTNSLSKMDIEQKSPKSEGKNKNSRNSKSSQQTTSTNFNLKSIDNVTINEKKYFDKNYLENKETTLKNKRFFSSDTISEVDNTKNKMMINSEHTNVNEMEIEMKTNNKCIKTSNLEQCNVTNKNSEKIIKKICHDLNEIQSKEVSKHELQLTDTSNNLNCPSINKKNSIIDENQISKKNQNSKGSKSHSEANENSSSTKNSSNNDSSASGNVETLRSEQIFQNVKIVENNCNVSAPETMSKVKSNLVVNAQISEVNQK